MTIDPAGLPEDSTAPRGYAALQFDPAAYMHFVEDNDLTEEQAVELLEAIWSIVVSFVDLGFGLDPIHQVWVISQKRLQRWKGILWACACGRNLRTLPTNWLRRRVMTLWRGAIHEGIQR